MLKIIIEDDEGRKTVIPFVREEITIGRQEGNTVRLTERNVSRRHARLLRAQSSVTVEDLGSYTGVKVNGERIQGTAFLSAGDLVQIGDYDLAIEYEQAAATSSNLEPTGDRENSFPPSSPTENAWVPTPLTLSSIEAVPTAVEGMPSARHTDPIITESQQAPERTMEQATTTVVQGDDPLDVPVKQGKSSWLFAVMGLFVGIGLMAYFIHRINPQKELSPVVAEAVKEEAVQEVVPPREPASHVAPSIARGTIEEKLSTSRAAVNQRQWDKAKDILESCLDEQGMLHAQASDLLSKMANEMPLKKNLDLAEKALNAHDFEAARNYLNLSAKTQLLAALHLELSARWEDEKPLAAKPQPTPKELATKSYEEGVAFFKQDKLSDAKAKFEACLKSDARFSNCHKALGGVHAKMGNTEKGFFHYKQFLKQAPNDKDAPRVQAIVDAYEASVDNGSAN